MAASDIADHAGRKTELKPRENACLDLSEIFENACIEVPWMSGCNAARDPFFFWGTTRLLNIKRAVMKISMCCFKTFQGMHPRPGCSILRK